AVLLVRPRRTARRQGRAGQERDGAHAQGARPEARAPVRALPDVPAQRAHQAVDAATRSRAGPDRDARPHHQALHRAGAAGQSPADGGRATDPPRRGAAPRRFPEARDRSALGQAALAFLLIKYGVSVAVSLSPTFNLTLDAGAILPPPLAFDNSHNAHRA